MVNVQRVNRYTRAGRDGRVIYCPDCGNGRRVYHFSWGGITCGIEGCNTFHHKGAWLINPPMMEKVMTEHTKGPWRIDHESIQSIPTGDTVALLCDINAPKLGTVLDWPRSQPEAHDDAENVANAQLIAAAPALKALVVGFLATLDVGNALSLPEGEDEAVVRTYYNQNIELFNAAIDIIDPLVEKK